LKTLFRFGMFILALGLFLPILSCHADTNQQLEGSGLAVASDPPGASVYLDGIKEGVTPLVLPLLPPASYSIRLSKEGYFDREMRVSLPREGRLALSLDMERASGKLTLRVRAPGDKGLPLNPVVYVDGVRVGGASAGGVSAGGAGGSVGGGVPAGGVSAGGVPAPDPTLLLDEGSHSLRVRAFGWEDVYSVVYVKAGETRVLEALLVPASFGIRAVRPGRRRFNPAGSGSLGSTTVAFEVSAPGRGTFFVLDSEGQTRFQKELGPFTSWSQSVSWDGRDQEGNILPDGNYTLKIEAAGETAAGAADAAEGATDAAVGVLSAEIEVALDTSVRIVPSQTGAAVSGLSWAPGAELNPRHSWQVEGSILFGKPVREEAWRSLPFAIAFSASALERLEIGAAVNMTPRLEGKALFSPGLSLKAGILRAEGSRLPLNLAMGFRYGFFGGEALSPFGLPSGPELFIPFSVELNRLFAKTTVTLLLVPALWWPGGSNSLPKGDPLCVVSGALAFRRSPLSAALSLRTESPFGGRPFQRIMAGGEIKFVPSLVVLSLSAGAWFESSRRGFYGGIGIGVIN
jgi:hypothetical protein